MGIPEDSVIVHVDKMASLKGLKPGVCGRRCDYLIVTCRNQRICAVFVELKKTLGHNLSDGMDQLRQSRPLLDYLHSVCRIHFGGSEKHGMAVRYWLIGERTSDRIDKQNISMNRPWRIETHVDIRVAAIVSNVVGFNELWSGT